MQPAIQNNLLKKVVIIGPESTGKSTLCKQLADHFHTQWVPEYAREYLLKNGPRYTYEDLLAIAKGQLALEDAYTQMQHTKASPYLFIYTDMYLMKVWSEFVYGKCHDFILQQIASRKYDLYLLCKTDLPWVKDELREYPELETREKLYEKYKNILKKQTTPWVEIKGDYDGRLQTAIEVVKSL